MQGQRRATAKARGRAFAAGVASAALLALGLPAGAPAAVVAVTETPGMETNAAVLLVRGLPEEKQHLTVSVLGKDNGYLRVQLVDPQAPLDYSAPCSGGGPIGNPVVCPLHEPKPAEMIYESKLLSKRVPGTEWQTSMQIELGQEADFLDASSLPGEERPWTIVLDVTGGDGADEIRTANGDDIVDPGPGADFVTTFGGSDSVDAGPTADGPDVYSLGGLSYDNDVLSYRRRTEPVAMSNGLAGAAGENDELYGVEALVGGAARDDLVGGAEFNRFDGLGGNDRLVGGGFSDILNGGPGNDQLDGGDGDDLVISGPGDDLLRGGAGDDRLLERAEGVADEGTSGNDGAFGEDGDDTIDLQEDADYALGGAGDDTIYGGEGADRLEGYDGNDRVVGEAGVDELFGGAGEDEVYASRAPQRLFAGGPEPVDSAADQIDCGPDRDFASVNPWDAFVNCEEVKRVAIADILRPRRRGHRNRWLLPVSVASGGVLRVESSASSVATTRTVAGSIFDVSATGHRPLFALGLGRGARNRLRRQGSLRVWITVHFTPDGGLERTAHRVVELRASRSPRR